MTRPTYDVRVDWDNDGDYSDVGEDVTDRVLARTALVVQYGRDQARTLSPIAPGRAQLEVDNRSGDYSPENTSSPLSGDVKPGRPLRIRATHNSTTYGLFTGYLDDFDVLPDVEDQSITLSALDALGRLRGKKVTTDLWSGITTGDAIGYVLDAAGWSSTARDIDRGGTTLGWWWVDDGDAFTAIQELVEAEGPPALVTVSPEGSLVFRGRHHRLTRAASTTSQATFRGSGAEPTMAKRLVYDHGWRDIVNSVSIDVDVRLPEGELSAVWQTQATYTIADGETLPVTARVSDPFIGAVAPVSGTDFVLLSGAVSATLSRDRGVSTTINLTASGGPAVVSDLQLRAYSVPVAYTKRISVQHDASVADHDLRSYGDAVPWVNEHDALAVGELILAQYANRRPVVTMRVVGGHDTRHTQQLGRDLSDRVHIVEPATGLDADFYVETIKHTTDGVFHETEFGCEKAPDVPADVMLLDTGLLGTNTLAAVGVDDPDTVFVLDTQLLGTGRIAY